MQESRLRNIVAYLKSAEGSYQGLIQIPFHVGACLNLVHMGVPAAQALASVVTWLVGFPRLFSFGTEILGGVVGKSLGIRGSFMILPMGFLLRSTAALGFAIGCIWHDPEAVIAICATAVIIGEIGRSLISGALEDAYTMTARRVCNDSADLVACCDVIGQIKLQTLRAVFAFVGTFAVMGAHLMEGGGHHWLIASPFVVVGLMEMIACGVSFNWYRWAIDHVTLENTSPNLGSMWGQTKVFFQKMDFLFCLGIGGAVLFLLIMTVNLSPLTIDDAHLDLAANNLTLTHIFTAAIIGASIPFANMLGVKVVYNHLLARWKRVDIFRSFDGIKGFGLVLLWCLIAICVLLIEFPAPAIPVVVAIVALLFAPMYAWVNWMRNPLTEEAEKHPDYAVHFGESRVFYFSLIEGGKETAFATTVLFFDLVPDLGMPKFASISLIIGVCCIAIWMSRRHRTPDLELVRSTAT